MRQRRQGQPRKQSYLQVAILATKLLIKHAELILDVLILQRMIQFSKCLDEEVERSSVKCPVTDICSAPMRQLVTCPLSTHRGLLLSTSLQPLRPPAAEKLV